MISQNKEFWTFIIFLVIIVLSLRKPFWGYLIFVFLMFFRPQDDRTSLQAYHFPQLVLILTTLSFLFQEVMMKKKSVWPKNRLFGAFILFFIWMLIDSFFACLPDVTWAAVQEFLFIVVLFYLTIQLIDTEKKIKILFSVILLCGLSFAYTLQFHGTHSMESISGQSFTRLNFAKINFNFGQPNYLAFTMIIMFFLSIVMALYSRNALMKICLLISCLVYLYTLIQTASRGASLSFLITLVFFWVYSKQKIIYIVILALLVIFVLPLAKESFPNYFNRLETIRNYEEDTSAMNRITLWRTGIEFILERPVFGIGWGGFSDERIAFNSSHNSYIQVASELGVFGFMIWISLLISSWLDIFRLKRKINKLSERRFLHYSALTVELCIIAFIAQSFTSGIAHRELLYFFIAIGCAIKSLSKNKNSVATHKKG